MPRAMRSIERMSMTVLKFSAQLTLVVLALYASEKVGALFSGERISFMVEAALLVALIYLIFKFFPTK
jgi:hypothetical protein